jgi:hypothetical protein
VSEHSDGGPAFPSAEIDVETVDGDVLSRRSVAGMSLRDYFATKALQGALANPRADRSASARAQFARDAYAMADAMLSERSKESS